jgi:hypothetical protein
MNPELTRIVPISQSLESAHRAPSNCRRSKAAARHRSRHGFKRRPTHDEQEMSVLNGRYACTCYHPSTSWRSGTLRSTAVKMVRSDPRTPFAGMGCRPLVRPRLGTYGLPRKSLSYSSSSGFIGGLPAKCGDYDPECATQVDKFAFSAGSGLGIRMIRAGECFPTRPCRSIAEGPRVPRATLSDAVARGGGIWAPIFATGLRRD